MRYLFPLNPYNQQRQFQKPVWVYPAHLAMYATHLRNQGHDVIWDSGKWFMRENDPVEGVETVIVENDFQIDVDFERLPFPDRVFTDAKNPRWQTYGNYVKHPATHYMSSNLCWWSRCSFCVDTLKLNLGEKRGIRSVDHVMAEIEDCARLGFKEMFDDAGTIPIGDWLEKLCVALIKTGMNKRMMLGCNLKPIEEKIVPFKLMRAAGFRFTLVGVESANQGTVDKISKGQKSENVIKNMKAMRDAGLYVHATYMSSYPHETPEEEEKTIELCNFLLRKGYVRTSQVSIYMPPRTEPPRDTLKHKSLKRYFNVYKSTEFWYNQALFIKSWDDFKYIFRGFRPYAHHSQTKM